MVNQPFYTKEDKEDFLLPFISMNDNTHMFSESVVIITDFYLFKKYNDSLLEEYCIYFGIDKCSEEGLKEKYPIPKELLLKVESLVELL